jgi:hypothetical protein
VKPVITIIGLILLVAAGFAFGFGLSLSHYEMGVLLGFCAQVIGFLWELLNMVLSSEDEQSPDKSKQLTHKKFLRKSGLWLICFGTGFLGGVVAGNELASPKLKFTVKDATNDSTVVDAKIMFGIQGQTDQDGELILDPRDLREFDKLRIYVYKRPEYQDGLKNVKKMLDLGNGEIALTPSSPTIILVKDQESNRVGQCTIFNAVYKNWKEEQPGIYLSEIIKTNSDSTKVVISPHSNYKDGTGARYDDTHVWIKIGEMSEITLRRR